MVAFMSRKSESKTEIAAARVPGKVQRLAVFGPPLLLEGEDAAAYDELLGRICAAVKTVDIIYEIFIDDVASLEWEVLRLRRLKWTLMQETGLKALENFLAGKLDYDSERVADRLTKILQHNLPEEHADSAQTLARKYARNEQHAVDTINEALASIDLDMGDIERGVRADKAQELVQDYLRRKPDAVTRVNELLPDAGVSMDTFMTKALRDKIDDIERIDRLTAIAETRRNAALREIERRRAVLGETLRRSVQEIEDDDFADGELVPELPPPEGKNAACRASTRSGPTAPMRGPAPARKPPGAALAQRETRFATRSAFPFVPFQPCQKRWKRLRARSPGQAPTRKPKSARAASPKRRSICAGCVMRAINCCPML
jgi:hypothetical protein